MHWAASDDYPDDSGRLIRSRADAHYKNKVSTNIIEMSTVLIFTMKTNLSHLSAIFLIRLLHGSFMSIIYCIMLVLRGDQVIVLGCKSTLGCCEAPFKDESRSIARL